MLHEYMKLWRASTQPAWLQLSCVRRAFAQCELTWQYSVVMHQLIDMNTPAKVAPLTKLNEHEACRATV